MVLAHPWARGKVRGAFFLEGKRIDFLFFSKPILIGSPKEFSMNYSGKGAPGWADGGAAKYQSEPYQNINQGEIAPMMAGKLDLVPRRRGGAPSGGRICKRWWLGIAGGHMGDGSNQFNCIGAKGWVF